MHSTRPTTDPVYSRFHNWACIAVLSVLFLTINVGFFRTYALDDSFIGFDNAQNLAAGRGFDFNPGEKVLTTSGPLAVVLYATISRITGAQITDVAQVIALLACATIIVFGFLIARRFVSPFGSVICVGTFVSTPYLSLLWSHESYVSVALSVVGLYLLLARRALWAAAVIGLAALFRPEAMLLVPIVIWYTRVTLKSWPSALVAGLIALTPFAIWIVAAVAHFGTFISQTFSAKQAQLAYSTVGPYVWGAVMYSKTVELAGVPRFLSTTLWPVAAIGLIIGLIRGAIRPAHVVVLLWVVATTALYVLARVPIFIWYCFQFAAVLAVVQLVAWTPGKARLSPRVANLLAWVGKSAAVIVALLSVAVPMAIARDPQRIDNLLSFAVQARYNDSAYHRIGAWLAARTPNDDSVAYLEIGQLRYYSQRRIVDLEGAVNAGVPDHLRTGDSIWALKQYRPDLYIDNPGWHVFVNPAEYDWFGRAYRAVGAVRYSDASSNLLTVYALVDPKMIPAPDSLDARANILSIRLQNNAVAATVVPSAPDFDQVDVRVVLPEGCFHGDLRMDGRGLAWHRTFSLATSLKPERISISGNPVVGSEGQVFRLSLTGCPSIHLAPRPAIRTLPLFSFENPSAPVGPPSNAFSLYER